MTVHLSIRAQQAARAAVLGASASLAPSRSRLLPNLGTMSERDRLGCRFCVLSLAILFHHCYKKKISSQNLKNVHRPCLARALVPGQGWRGLAGPTWMKVPTEERKRQK